MKLLLVALLALAGLNTAFAGSKYLDDADLGQCTYQRDGRVELREAANGDLSIKFVGLNTNRCGTLRFYDAYSDRTIKTYQIKGSSYTLSKQQAGELNKDCKVGFEVYTRGRGYQAYTISLGWCSKYSKPKQKRNNGWSYQWSNKRNCKLMKNGSYQNKNVADKYCSPASGKQTVSYEWSKKNNCKVMINGRYANRNVSDSYCKARH